MVSDFNKMDTPWTSGRFKKICVTTNEQQVTSEKCKEAIVSIMDKDKRQLLSFFPIEIWLNVLGSVDRGSLESVNNASSFFRLLLYPDRQLFLFLSVWKILGVQFEVDSDPVYSDRQLYGWDFSVDSDNDSNNTSDDDSNNITDDDSIGVSDDGKPEKPRFSIILKLRLVCRDWCLAVNEFYEEMYHNYDTLEALLLPRVQSGLDSTDEVAINRNYERSMGYWTKYKLSSVEIVEDFMEHFEATHDPYTNPFPFRNVTFDSTPDILNYLTRVIPLVKKYGHHIWFCDMRIFAYFEDYPDMNVECYLKFREMITLMPNLKVLQLQFAEEHFHNPIVMEVLANFWSIPIFGLRRIHVDNDFEGFDEGPAFIRQKLDKLEANIEV